MKYEGALKKSGLGYPMTGSIEKLKLNAKAKKLVQVAITLLIEPIAASIYPIQDIPRYADFTRFKRELKWYQFE